MIENISFVCEKCGNELVVKRVKCISIVENKGNYADGKIVLCQICQSAKMKRK
jgi:hypothetical protein